MKNTIEFLKEHGIVEKLQKALDIAPINAVDDIEKDPNMKDFQVFALRYLIGDKVEDNKFTDGYFKAIHKDIIDALDLKKEGSGNKFLSMLVDLVEEATK